MKRGSALLIVLGMLAFIVASAVGFAAYMRYSRLPSSYLRRTSASRLLAKAALAEAIDIVDNSIGNSPWPGKTGKDQIRNYRRITDDENNDANVIDYWQDRCFIGSNALVSVDSTVSTLCTEALAYIPPPIVNEVRYYSRRSLAAQWHTLGFDSGRFAFCAVDVSDFFDVNRTSCSPLDITGAHISGRNSSDTGRVTLAHLFENEAHTGPGSVCTPDRWDEFVDTYLDNNGVPFVSLADLSLAMNKSGLPATMNPFCNFILSGANFVTSESGPQAEMLRNMCFVTDSCYVTTNRAPDAIDLSRATDQPFYGHEQGKSVQELIGQLNSRFRQHLETKDSPLRHQGEILQLYDYLDEDSVPVSLAVPTVERTPMITGVSLGGDVHLVVSDPNTYEKLSADGNLKYEVTTYTMKLAGSLDLNVGAAYPFKYERRDTGNYSVEAVATIALTPSFNVRTGGKLRCNAAKKPGLVSWEDHWNDVVSAWRISFYDGDAVNSVACKKPATQQLTLPGSVTREEETALDDIHISFGSLSDVEFTVDMPENEYYNADRCSFRKCKRKKKEIVNEVETWVDDPTFQDLPIADRIGWRAVQGDLSGTVAPADMLSQTYVPSVQVWVRVFKDGETVDLVPACWRDDRQKSEILQMAAAGASQYPLLRFVGSAGVQQTQDELKRTGDVVAFSPKAYLADDPRFNFAPENFEALDEQGQTFKELWLSRVSARAADRDGDIFMETSDVGYLQSVYELAFIQQVSFDRDGFGAIDGDGYNGNAGSLPAKGAMWRTYSQYDNGSSNDELDYLDVISGSRGARVSPYAQSANIAMAALANTPLNWWAASTNDTVNTKVHGSESTAAKYSFSEKGGALVKMSYDNLESIAGNMLAKFRDSGSPAGWRRLFDDAGWWDGGASDSGDTLCGVTLDNGVKLHSVDRKFLHGFWKECFENRQQLFLIFVRAEPMMMGGGGMGQTPPQLGARAVALVWRDPAQTRDDVSGLNSSGGPRPHRTRILFYRQFD